MKGLLILVLKVHSHHSAVAVFAVDMSYKCNVNCIQIQVLVFVFFVCENLMRNSTMSMSSEGTTKLNLARLDYN